MGPTSRNLDANGLRICACLGLMSTKRASTWYRRRPLGPSLGCDQVAFLQNAADRDFARPPHRRGNLAIFPVRHAHQRLDTNTFRRCDFNVGHCGLRPCNGAPKGLPSLPSHPVPHCNRTVGDLLEGLPGYIGLACSFQNVPKGTVPTENQVHVPPSAAETRCFWRHGAPRAFHAAPFVVVGVRRPLRKPTLLPLVHCDVKLGRPVVLLSLSFRLDSGSRIRPLQGARAFCQRRCRR